MKTRLMGNKRKKIKQKKEERRKVKKESK